MDKALKVVSLLIFFSVAFIQDKKCLASPANLVKWDYGTDPHQEAHSANNILSVIKNKEHSQESKVSQSGTFGYFTGFFDIMRIRNLIHNVGSKIEIGALCVSCKVTMSYLQHRVRNGATEDDIGTFVNKICTAFHIEKPSVCTGLTQLFKREVTTVLVNIALDPEEVCGLLIPGCGYSVNPLHNWIVPETPFPKPPIKPPKTPKVGSPVSRVLHISDVHIDPKYREGSNANCGEPLCCRRSSGTPAIPSDAAGYWGDYRNCDIPLRMLENMLAHINKTHKVDYVIWTGDIPPHDIWNNSREEAVYLLHAASNVIHKYLGHIPVFPALGNHESSPVNSFPIPQVKGNDSISWLYDEVAKAWLQWLPDSSFTLKSGAYYSVAVNPGLRIISINMNYCNSLNWWLLLNSTDPTGELSWLVVELQKAEDKGEKVHIIGHIPPGVPDCLAVWSYNYNKIINRYESTVTAQFFGHTHKDEFEVFYDKSGVNPRATNIAYIGPSVTTYDGVNPGYRIYTVDGNYPESSRVVLDHESYYLNLTKANLLGKTEWEFEYSAKQAYNMTSLLPSDWDYLTKKFEKDDKLFQKFHRFYGKLSDYITNKCDTDCKAIMLCRLRRSQSNDPLVC